jgi:ribosomal protein S18 acetylase RimI-like enzyme
MTINTYNSSDIFNAVNKKYFPYYALYKNLLDNTDSALFYSEKCEEPVGVMILRPGMDEDTLHISCIEVAEPIRRNGWGSKMLATLKNEINGVYKKVTLRCINSSLIPFYLRNGFRLVNSDPNNIIMEAAI